MKSTTRTLQELPLSITVALERGQGRPQDVRYFVDYFAGMAKDFPDDDPLCELVERLEEGLSLHALSLAMASGDIERAG